VPKKYVMFSLQTKGGINIVATDDILDTKEVAKLLKVSVRTITKLAERGDLTGFKVGDLWRFQLSDVEAFIESQKRKRQQGKLEP